MDAKGIQSYFPRIRVCYIWKAPQKEVDRKVVDDEDHTLSSNHGL